MFTILSSAPRSMRAPQPALVSPETIRPMPDWSEAGDRLRRHMPPLTRRSWFYPVQRPAVRWGNGALCRPSGDRNLREPRGSNEHAFDNSRKCRCRE
jgi:hypothetical protein